MPVRLTFAANLRDRAKDKTHGARPEGEERPCLHCMMVELIEDFLSEYPVAPSVSDKVDTGEADEVIVAVAKTVAELT